jgi:hypothetical protein
MHICIHSFTQVSNRSSAQPSLPTFTPAPPPSAYMSAHARIGGAAAKNGPRHFEDWASASATPALARRRAESGAYRGQRGDTRDVPRADVHVIGVRRLKRLRAEAARGRRRRKALARCGADYVGAHNHTRPTAHVRTCGRVCGARTHSVTRSSM